MSQEDNSEKDFFSSEPPSSGDSDPVLESDILDQETNPTIKPFWPYFLACLILFAGSFYGSMRFGFYLNQGSAGGQIVNLADEESLQTLVDRSNPNRSSGVYRLVLVMYQRRGIGSPINLTYNTMVETFLTRDQRGRCYLTFSDLAYRNLSLEEQIKDPDEASYTYGLIRVPCSRRQ